MGHMLIRKNASRAWIVLGVLFAVVGIGVSLYALQHHLQVMFFGQTDAECNINALFNCDRVAKSAFSEIFHIPLGVFGMGYFLAILTILIVAQIWNRFELAVLQTYTVLVSLGVLTSLVLSLISTFRIGALCIVCMSFYAVNFLQGVALYIYYRQRHWVLWGRGVFGVGILAACMLTLNLVGYRVAQRRVERLMTNPKYTAQVRHFFRKALSLKPVQIPLALEGSDTQPGDIWLGNPKSSVVMVEFLDHMCPMCQDFAPTFEKIRKEYEDRVLFVIKQFPIEAPCNPKVDSFSGHLYACESARLAQCAQQLGKYEQYQKILFTKEIEFYARPQTRSIATIADPNHIGSALEIGMNRAVIKSCLASAIIFEKIKKDIALGYQVGVGGTPVLFVDGYRFRGNRTAEALRYELDYHLKSQ